MSQFSVELGWMLREVEVMKPRAGMMRVLPSGKLRSARMTTGLGRKRSLSTRQSKGEQDQNTGDRQDKACSRP